MSVREYIGARYVPKFSGAWDSSKAYEPLEVVQSQGDSYISVQPVPAGAALTDAAYWLLTYQFNAQYGALKITVDGNVQSIAEILGQLKEIAEWQASTDSNLKANTEALEAIDSEDGEKFSVVSGVTADGLTVYHDVTIEDIAAVDILSADFTNYRFNMLKNYNQLCMINAGGLGGCSLNRGQILTSEAPEYGGEGYINIAKDGTVSWIADGEGSLRGADLQSFGAYNAFRGFWPLVESGIKSTGAPEHDERDGGTYAAKDMSRVFIGQKQGESVFHVVLVEGRTPKCLGLTGEELRTLAYQMGFYDAYCMDGGGSSQCWINPNTPFNIFYSNDNNFAALYTERNIRIMMGVENA